MVPGEQNGRKMGFPTANLDQHGSGQLLPAAGVYAVSVRTDASQILRHGMLNIGHRPTFGGTTMSVEVNIFNWTGDLYGREITVSFLHHIREERKFDSMEELEQQLEKDKEHIEQLLKKDYERNE